MKRPIFIILIVLRGCILMSQAVSEPFFSYPPIKTSSYLEATNPNSSQLDPNKIHLVILADGYNVIDESATQIELLIDNSVPGLTIPLLNRFFNSEVPDDVIGEYPFYEVYTGPNNNGTFLIQGDSEDYLDYLFGDEGRNLLEPGHWLGYAPFKQYSAYFNTYRVLYNSNNGNGIGHPYAVDFNSYQSSGSGTAPVAPDCEGNIPSCTDPVTIPTPSYANQVATFWSSNFDFCDSHRAISVDYNKINDFINIYFPNVPVFVIVLVNTSDYGGAANINQRTAAVSAAYSRGTGGSYPHFDERGGVHEFAHIFGRLQDEYWFDFDSTLSCFSALGGSVANFHNAPNRTDGSYQYTNPNHKWHHWSTAGVASIGHWQHSIPACMCFTSYGTSDADYFKPTDNKFCLMEEVVNVRPFCAVCQEAIIEQVHTLVSPVRTQSPDNSQILPASSSLTFEVNLTVPNPNTMRVQWELVNSQGQTQLLETDYNGAGDQNGINGNGGGAPSGVYRWHFECEKFNVSGFTEPGIYKVRAKIFDMTGNSEGASNRWVRHPNHEIDTNDPNDLNHERIVEWQVEYNGYSGIDLYVSDLPNDLGTEPSTASDILWQSPDIWLCNTNNSNCAAPGEAVSYNGTGSEAQVRFNVKNRGCKVYEPTDNGSANVYWAKAGTGLEWPTSWNGNTFGNGALQGDFIANIPLNTVIDKNNPNGVTFTANWTLQDPSNYASIANYNDDVQHFCMLVALNSTSDAYQMVSNVAWPLFHNVKMSNNVAWKNLSIIDVSGSSALGETTSTDVIRGGEIIVGNNTNQTKPIKLAFEIPSTEVGNPITAEAEVRVTLHSSLWSAWMSGGQLGNNIQVHDASKRQIRILNSPATLSGISMAPNAHYGVYVSVNYLTQQRSSKEFFALRLSQIADDSTQKIVGGETYLFRADPNRNLFTANGGGDVEVLVGQAFQNKGNSIGENALFNWYNQQGARIYTGSIRSDSASTAGSEQFTLEVISATDGYKDYDQITVHRILGKITSMVPNPINSGTLAIGYKVSSAVSSPKIRLIHINTQTYTEHSISNGTGTLNVNVAGYASGAYSVVLIDGNSQSMDDELLVIQ